MSKKNSGTVIVPDQIDYRLSVDAFEKTLIHEALIKSNNNVQRAAILLNLPRPTLIHIMKKKNIVAQRNKKSSEAR